MNTELMVDIEDFEFDKFLKAEVLKIGKQVKQLDRLIKSGLEEAYFRASLINFRVFEIQLNRLQTVKSVLESNILSLKLAQKVRNSLRNSSLEESLECFSTDELLTITHDWFKKTNEFIEQCQSLDDISVK